ncbi:hypothetical protein ABK040_016588 [Willaertia magna]
MEAYHESASDINQEDTEDNADVFNYEGNDHEIIIDNNKGKEEAEEKGDNGSEISEIEIGKQNEENEDLDENYLDEAIIEEEFNLLNLNNNKNRKNIVIYNDDKLQINQILSNIPIKEVQQLDFDNLFTFTNTESLAKSGVISSWKNKNDREKSKGIRLLKRYIEERKTLLDQKLIELSLCKQKMEDISLEIQQSQQQHDELSRKYSLLKEKNSVTVVMTQEQELSIQTDIENLRKYHLKKIDENLSMKRQFYELQRDYNERKTAVDELLIIEEKIKEYEIYEGEDKTLMQSLRISNENKLSKALMRKKSRDELERVKQTNEQTQRQLDSLKQVKECKKKAKINLMESLAKHNDDKKREEEELRFEKKLVEIDKLNQLHSEIRNNIKKKIEDNKEKNYKKQKKMKEEFNKLLESGRNPYEVFRAKEEEVIFKKTKRRIEENIKQRKEEILYALEQEKSKEFMNNTNKKRLKEKLQQEISVIHKEKKLGDYISSKTLKGEEMIDPLSSLKHIFPSKVMIARDKTQGLGKLHETNPNYFERMSKEFKEQHPSKLQSIEEEIQNDSQLRYGEHSSERIIVKELSELEKQYRQKAFMEWEKNRVQKQVVLGKEFKGQAFLPEPREVVFKDFEIGKEYIQKISLINGSYTFNTFKILPLNSDIVEFFEIIYTPPGRMSAGTFCTITIKFVPTIEKDIETAIPVFAMTGNFEIPIKCYTKKVDVSVDKTKINFSAVVLEYKRETLKLTNVGALSVPFKIIGEGIERYGKVKDSKNIRALRNDSAKETEEQKDEITEIHTNEEEQEMERILEFSSLEGILEGYSQLFITLSFCATTPTKLSTFVTIRLFEESTHKDLRIDIDVEGKSIPVFMKNEIIDFDVCYINSSYKKEFKIFNTHSSALRFNVKLPKCLTENLQCFPKIGFVQANSSLPIRFVFNPSTVTKDLCKKYYHEETNELLVPFKVEVADYSNPIELMFRSIICRSDIEITPKLIDFGRCSLEETVTCEISLQNLSTISQQIRFVDIPREITIMPEVENFLSIEGNEIQKYQVVFSPSKERDYKFNITCETNRKECYKAKCKGIGIRHPLKFSQSRFAIPPTPIEDISTFSLELSNTSKKTYFFKILSPANSKITFSPDSGTINPSLNQEIQVSFEPPLLVKPKVEIKEEVTKDTEQGGKGSLQKKKSTPVLTKSKSKKKQEEVPKKEEIIPLEVIEYYNDWRDSEANDSWKHKSWYIPCVFGASPAIEDMTEVMFLQVDTTSILKPLKITIEDMVDTSNKVVDFGRIPIFHEHPKKISVFNNFGRDIQLNFELHSIVSSFSIENLEKSITLEESAIHDIILYSYPTSTGNFETTLRIWSGKYTENYKIMVTSETPPLLISYGDDKPYIDLGDFTLEKELHQSVPVKKVISLKNGTDKNIPFKCFIEEAYPMNQSGSNPFTLNLEEGLVPSSKESKKDFQVEISCLPDHQPANNLFESKLIMEYGSGSIMKVPVIAKARQHGPFIHFDLKKPENVVADVKKRPKTPQKPSSQQSTKTPKTSRKGSTLNLVEAEQDIPASMEFTYKFSDTSINSAKTITFEIGCQKSNILKPTEKKVDYTLQIFDLNSCFYLDNAKGTLDIGGKKEITIWFTPSSEKLQLQGDENKSILVDCVLEGLITDPYPPNTPAKFIAKLSGNILIS